MKFSNVDSVLLPWANGKDLAVSTSYKGEDVRSIQITGLNGAAQVWIEVGDQITVHAWDYSKQRTEEVTKLMDLGEALDRVYQVARDWCDS